MSNGFAYLGGVQEGQMVLGKLLAAGWRPDLIVALEDEAVLRASGGKPWRQEDWAGIPLVKVPAFHSPAALMALGLCHAQGVLAVGISEILKPSFLDLFPLGVYGFHGSLLPELAGPAPANWAILKGYRATGTTLLKYTSDLDGGTIVAQGSCSLDERTCIGPLYAELSVRSAELWLAHWPRIASGQVQDRPQGKLVHNRRRRPEDGRIRWQGLDAVQLSRRIRALSDPYPGAYFWWRGRRVWVHSVLPSDDRTADEPALAGVSPDGLLVSLRGGTLLLGDLRDDEGQAMDPARFSCHVGCPMGELHRGRKVLAVVAHPDDEVLGPGGTLIRHFKRGDEVFVRIVCSGDSIRYKEGEQDQEGDAQTAAYYLGAQTRGLGFPDQRLDSGSNLPLIQALEAEVRALRPNLVYTHYWGDINADHIRIAEAVDVAVRPFNAPWVERTLAFETASSTEWTLAERSPSFHPMVYVDITAELDRKVDAMRAYRSEIREYPHPRSLRSLRERAGFRGSECGLEAAEAFMLMREVQR